MFGFFMCKHQKVVIVSEGSEGSIKTKITNNYANKFF